MQKKCNDSCYILWLVGMREAASASKALVSPQRRQEVAAKAGNDYVLTPDEKLLLKIQPIWIGIASTTFSTLSPPSSLPSTGELIRRRRVASSSTRWRQGHSAAGASPSLLSAPYPPPPPPPPPLSATCPPPRPRPSASSPLLPTTDRSIGPRLIPSTSPCLRRHLGQVLLRPFLKWQHKQRVKNGFQGARVWGV